MDEQCDLIGARRCGADIILGFNLYIGPAVAGGLSIITPGGGGVGDNRYKPSHALVRLDKGCVEPQYGPNNNWLTPHTELYLSSL